MLLFSKKSKLVIQAFSPSSGGSCLTFNNVWWGKSMFVLIFIKGKATSQNMGNILIQALWGSCCNHQNSTQPLRKASGILKWNVSHIMMTAEEGATYIPEMRRLKRRSIYSEKQKGPDSLLMWVWWGQRIYTSEEHTLPTTECSFWATSLTICIIICRVHNKWRLPGLTGLILVLPAVFWLVGSQEKAILSLYLAHLPRMCESLSAYIQRTSLYISYLKISLWWLLVGRFVHVLI